VKTINYSPEGIDHITASLQGQESSWREKKDAAKAPAMSGQGDTPRLAYETAERYQKTYQAFVELSEATRSFLAAAKSQIVMADDESASQFEG